MIQSDAERKMQVGGEAGDRKTLYLGIAIHAALLGVGILAAISRNIG